MCKQVLVHDTIVGAEMEIRNKNKQIQALMIVYVKTLKSITSMFISLITFHSLCLNCGTCISECPSCYFKAAKEELAGRLFESDRAFLNLNTFKTLEKKKKANTDGWGIPSVKEMVQSQS